MSAGSERVKAWLRANPERARAIRFRSNNGVDLALLPPYPTDGKCELCGYSPEKKRLHWDHDHILDDIGLQKAECHRGWVCYGCNAMLGRIEAIGLDKISEYLRLDPSLAPGGDLIEASTEQEEEETIEVYALRSLPIL